MFRKQATNASATANYTNIVYDSLSYNMASATLTIESNNNCCRCHLIYFSLAASALKRLDSLDTFTWNRNVVNRRRAENTKQTITAVVCLTRLLIYVAF